MRIKACTIFIFVLTLHSASFSQYFWEKIDSPTSEFLRTVYFADSLKGWVAGDSGLIFFTSDGGKNWTQQFTGTKSKIMKLFFLDENHAWGVAWDEAVNSLFTGTDILKTTNGGQNWSVNPYREENIFLNSIYFLDTLKGFTGGFPGKILVTDDGGSTWWNPQIDTLPGAFFPPANFNFFNNEYGFAVGGQFDISGIVWRTTNGGDNWRPFVVGPEPIFDIHFFDSLNVMGVGGDFEYGVSVIRTTDAGEFWDYQTLGIFGVPKSMSFRTETEGWVALSIGEKFLYTLDAGETWKDSSTVDSSNIYDLVFPDSLTGYAVGEEGVILKYKYEFPSTLIETINDLDGYYLFQNYPNPFNSTTSIRYQISEPDFVSLKIYNMLGKCIADLVNDYQQDGSYSKSWNASHNPSGVYFLNLNVGGNTLTRKMILLK